MTNYLTAALAEIDGYTPRRRAVDRALDLHKTRRVETIDLGRYRRNLADEIADALTGDEPIDLDDLAARATEPERRIEADAVVLGVLASAAGAAIERLTTTLRGNVDAALGYLAARMAETVAEVRELDGTLRTVATADAAIAEGRTGAWQALADAVARYDALRLAQIETVATSISGVDPTLPIVAPSIANLVIARGDSRIVARQRVERLGLYRDADEIRALAPRHDEIPAVLNGGARRGPWPGYDPHGTPTWPTSDRPNYLRWIVTNADVWVPTVGELAAAEDDARPAPAAPVSPPKPRPEQAGFARRAAAKSRPRSITPRETVVDA